MNWREMNNKVYSHFHTQIHWIQSYFNNSALRDSIAQDDVDVNVEDDEVDGVSTGIRYVFNETSI